MVQSKYKKKMSSLGIDISREEVAREEYVRVFTSAPIVSEMATVSNRSEYAEHNGDSLFGIVSDGKSFSVVRVKNGNCVFIGTFQSPEELAAWIEKFIGT